MTAFKPIKKITFYSWRVLAVSIIPAIMIVLWVSVYNQNVQVRHSILEIEQAFAEERVLNAELRNELYLILNPENLAEFTKERSLIRANEPHFVAVSQ